jgi:hypothetical protein
MKRYFKILVLVISAICIFIVGVGFGNYKTQQRLDKYITYELLSSISASELKVNIILLELLNSGDSATTKKRLESLVDAGLAQITLYVNQQPVKPDNDIIEAIKIAKKYREKHPEHRISPAIENSVKKTLDFVNDK